MCFHIVQELVTCRMAKGTSVGRHVMDIFGLLCLLEHHGHGLDDNSKLVIILCSLPFSLREFVVKTLKEDKPFSIFGLIKDLVTIEESMPVKESENRQGATSSGSETMSTATSVLKDKKYSLCKKFFVHKP